jgi:hypothetical protein
MQLTKAIDMNNLNSLPPPSVAPQVTNPLNTNVLIAELPHQLLSGIAIHSSIPEVKLAQDVSLGRMPQGSYCINLAGKNIPHTKVISDAVATETLMKASGLIRGGVVIENYEGSMAHIVVPNTGKDSPLHALKSSFSDGLDKSKEGLIEFGKRIQDAGGVLAEVVKSALQKGLEIGVAVLMFLYEMSKNPALIGNDVGRSDRNI